MEVRSNGGEAFRDLAKRFRAAGRDGAVIRKKLTATIQAELKRTVVDIQHEVMAVNSRGVSGAGTARREAFFQVHHRRGRARQHGLRAAIKRSVKSRVQYTGRKVGARIFIDASGLPQSQRAMPRHFNAKGGWKHPVYRRRTRKGGLVDVWVRQVGAPYFDNPIRRNLPRTSRAVKAAVDDVMRSLR